MSRIIFNANLQKINFFFWQGRRNGFSSGWAKLMKRGTCLKDFQKNSFHIAHPLPERTNTHIDEQLCKMQFSIQNIFLK